MECQEGFFCILIFGAGILSGNLGGVYFISDCTLVSLGVLDSGYFGDGIGTLGYEAFLKIVRVCGSTSGVGTGVGDPI